MSGPVVMLCISFVLLAFGVAGLFSSRRAIGLSAYASLAIGVPLALFGIFARTDETASRFATSCEVNGGEVVLVDAYVSATAVPVGTTGSVIAAGDIYVYECRVDGQTTERFETGEQIDGATDETE